MARLLLQGKDLEILGDDWSVGEADLCSRLITDYSMVRHARNTGDPWERELDMAGWAGEGSAEVIPKVQLEGVSGLHQVHEEEEAWEETPEAT